MQIIASAPQPAGYLTIIRQEAPLRRGRCDCPSQYHAFAFTRNKHVVQLFAAMRRFIRRPLIEVFGLLLVAAAAKIGYGEWAVGGIVALVPMYFGAVLTFAAIRSRRYEASAQRCPESCF